MNRHRSDSDRTLLLSILFAAALLLLPMLTYGADRAARQPVAKAPILLAVNTTDDAALDHLVEAIGRARNGHDEACTNALELKRMMHRLAIGQ